VGNSAMTGGIQLAYWGHPVLIFISILKGGRFLKMVIIENN